MRGLMRYLPGILLLQILTVVLVLLVLRSGQEWLWISAGLLALLIALLFNFWFQSIAEHGCKDAIADLRQEFAVEREKLRLAAERTKTRVLQETHRQIVRETNRAHARANFKVGAMLVGVMAAGGLLLISQFVTLGLLTVATGGGALAGYLARVQQERRRGQRLAGPPPADGTLPAGRGTTRKRLPRGSAKGDRAGGRS